ncbi:hypothetical protein, partial [Capnocytophaga sp. HP1101]
ILKMPKIGFRGERKRKCEPHRQVENERISKFENEKMCRNLPLIHILSCASSLTTLGEGRVWRWGSEGKMEKTSP